MNEFTKPNNIQTLQERLEKALKEGSDRERWNAYISALKDITKPELSSEIYKAYQAKLNEFFVKTVK